MLVHCDQTKQSHLAQTHHIKAVVMRVSPGVSVNSVASLCVSSLPSSLMSALVCKPCYNSSKNTREAAHMLKERLLAFICPTK